jgi:HD-GYP domain-containing protein (c-di-GMP phosphodiesterase class II)
MSTTTITLAGVLWLALFGYAISLGLAARRAGARARGAVATYAGGTTSGPLDDGTVALLTALQDHDGATGWHCRRVSLLSRQVGALLGLAEYALDDLEEAALVHDAGKLRVPARILRKPGPLTSGEWALVRRHPQWGAELLATVGGLSRHAAVVAAHHECWSGGGYPAGAVGAGIPLAARVIAACDAYDAITTERPHSQRRSPREALAELRACSGRQFDPTVVAALEAAMASRRVAV